MPNRLLSIALCACLLIQTGVTAAQDNTPANGAGPQGCPVTKSVDAFVPPSPYRNTASPGSFFFGTPKLWTLVHPDSWTGQKLVWWSQGNDRHTDAPPALTVTFERLDAPAPLMKTGRANWAFIDGQPPFITTGIASAPNAGCWQITGRLAGEEVKYVVWL